MKSKPVDIDEVLGQLEIPREYSYVPVRPVEGKFMFEWVRRQGVSRSLEVGLAYGRSAACIMAAHAGTHTCMDPYQEAYGHLGVRNLTSLGFHDRLRFIPDFSHHALPQLLAEKQQYDFAFIDGDHKFDSIALDFFYVDRLLAPNGCVLFHDAWMRGTQLVTKFIRSNRKDYRVIRCPIWNMLLFQKTGSDDRAWNHFREFYTFRGLFSHRVVFCLIKLGFFRSAKRSAASASPAVDPR